jgi:hypothetical protein
LANLLSPGIVVRLGFAVLLNQFSYKQEQVDWLYSRVPVRLNNGGNMYCPSCGAGNAQGLRYCKRCGENLSNQAAAPGTSFKKVKQGEYGWEIEEIEPPGISVKKLSGLFWAVAVFGFVSLVALFGSMIPLTLIHADIKTIVLVLIFGSAAIGSIAGMLIQQLSRLIAIIEDNERARHRVRPPVEQNYTQIDAPPRSVSGVTEHTTRNFDETVYDNRRARE